jgi:hypothetical protein
VARAAITTDLLVLNAGSVFRAGGTADANAGHEVAFGKSRRLIIAIHQGTSTAGTWTFQSGDRDLAAPKGGQGDLVITPGASEVQLVVVESARFMQADGKLYVDCNSLAALGSTISAVRLPAVG